MDSVHCFVFVTESEPGLLLTQEWGPRRKIGMRPNIAMAEEDAWKERLVGWCSFP